jgi:peptidylprolyl isomerase
MPRLAIVLLTAAVFGASAVGTSVVGAHAAEPTAEPAAEKPTKTASGLEYVDTKVGTGAAAKSGDTVTINYTIAIGDKKIAGSKSGTPMIFTIGKGQALKGLDEGVQGMKAGGQRKLTVPPSLGYGAEAVPKVPPNSTLLIDVELLEIK